MLPIAEVVLRLSKPINNEINNLILAGNLHNLTTNCISNSYLIVTICYPYPCPQASAKQLCTTTQKWRFRLRLRY